jgi:hypothetical protein
MTSPRSCFAIAAFLMLLAPVRPSAAAPVAPAAAVAGGLDTLSDGTTVGHWSLDNGLRVIARSIPGAPVVAITVAYPFGSDDDPPGRSGLALAMCQLGFLAPAGDLPQRSRAELDERRPEGWSFTATRRATMFSEIAPVPRFPAILREVATRMRGVTVSHEALRKAVEDAHHDTEQQVHGASTASLYWLAREVALGRGEADIPRQAAGRDLDRMTVAEAQDLLRQRFVPANAVLSLAGDLSGLDLHALVQNLFADIPAGSQVGSPAADSLRPAARVVRLGPPGPARAVVGIIAPALSDTLHPYFYFGLTMLASQFDQQWRKKGDPPGREFFHYAPFDEPDLARLFPPLESKDATPAGLTRVLNNAVDSVDRLLFSDESYEQVRRLLLGSLGGPLDEVSRTRSRVDRPMLYVMARSMAARELLGGERFWARYRRTIERMPAGGISRWVDYIAERTHQVRVVVAPAK